MSRWLVVNTDPQLHLLSDVQRERLQAVGARIVEMGIDDGPNFLSLARDADAILNADFRLTADLIEGLTRCQVISRYGIGYDNIDVAAATRRGIPVAIVTNFCSDEVANQAFTLWLSIALHIIPNDRFVREGRWDQSRLQQVFLALPIAGSRLGLVGFGGIAQAMSRRARSFGMTVAAYDPYQDEKVFERRGVDRWTLDRILSESDVVSLHVPLNQGTRHLIDRKALAMMKPTAVLINTARGPVVDEAALLEALRDKRIMAAGLDVLEQEPPDPDNPLFGLDNLVFSPHIASYSPSAVTKVRELAVDAVVRTLAGKKPLALVNPEVWRRPGKR